MDSAYDSYSNSNASGGTLDYIAPGDAFWVYGNDEETFTIQKYASTPRWTRF